MCSGMFAHDANIQHELGKQMTELRSERLTQPESVIECLRNIERTGMHKLDFAGDDNAIASQSKLIVSSPMSWTLATTTGLAFD